MYVPENNRLSRFVIVTRLYSMGCANSLIIWEVQIHALSVKKFDYNHRSHTHPGTERQDRQQTVKLAVFPVIADFVSDRCHIVHFRRREGSADFFFLTTKLYRSLGHLSGKGTLLKIRV